jgi:tRNA threonylcarbamoyl adenosine modification protein YeaZ
MPSPLHHGRVLALETSTASGSWALFQNGELLSEAGFSGRASATLPESMVLEISDRTPVDHILVGVGPGSFSGIRVAVALAQGLRFVWKCPVHAVRSSHAPAWQLSGVSFLGVFADAKRQQLFVTCYERGIMTRPSQIIERHELDEWLGKCSQAVSSEPLAGVPHQQLPQAADLIRYSLAHGLEPDLALDPIYLRPALGK